MKIIMKDTETMILSSSHLNCRLTLTKMVIFYVSMLCALRIWQGGWGVAYDVAAFGSTLPSVGSVPWSSEVSRCSSALLFLLLYLKQNLHNGRRRRWFYLFFNLDLFVWIISSFIYSTLILLIIFNYFIKVNHHGIYILTSNNL